MIQNMVQNFQRFGCEWHPARDPRFGFWYMDYAIAEIDVLGFHVADLAPSHRGFRSKKKHGPDTALHGCWRAIEVESTCFGICLDLGITDNPIPWSVFAWA